MRNQCCRDLASSCFQAVESEVAASVLLALLVGAASGRHFTPDQ